MPVINSETGTYVALREEVDHAISPERLATLIKSGAPNLSVKAGWPFHAIDERSGGNFRRAQRDRQLPRQGAVLHLFRLQPGLASRGMGDGRLALLR